MMFMKRSTSSRTPAERKRRLGSVVAKANERGEKVPRSVALIGFGPLSKAAQAQAQTLTGAAQRVLGRHKAGA
ncbi:hypothetical protein BH20VER1_BH20VER1_30570 [soil metagenome]